MYLRWAPNLFQECCYLLNTSCSLGSEGMPLQDGTSGAGRCPCHPGGLVARNALAGWLYALRQGRSRSSSSVPCPSLLCQITPFHATLSSPTLLWDSAAISMLLEHRRHGSAWCARSMLGHLGAWCPCATTVGVSWGMSCAAGESPQLCRVTLSPGAAVVHGVDAPLGLGSSGCGDSSRVVGCWQDGAG